MSNPLSIIQPLVSIVIPAYNESHSIRDCIEEIVDHLSPMGIDYEIVIVDDGSTDGTWAVIRGMIPEYAQLRAIRFSRNFGKEAAIYAGLRSVESAAAVVMDADNQHPPILLPEMIRVWRQSDIPIVEAVKEVRQKESAIRRIGAHLFYYLFENATGIEIHRATDFKLLDRKVIEQYLSLPERTRFFRGLTEWLGYPKIGIPFTPPERRHSQSKWSLGHLVKLARQSLISFSVLPLRLITWLGVITFVFSVILAIQTLWNKFNGKALDGFTTVILIQLGIGSLLMISLGLIGEYLGRIFEEIKYRPLFVVSETVSADRSEENE